MRNVLPALAVSLALVATATGVSAGCRGCLGNTYIVDSPEMWILGPYLGRDTFVYHSNDAGLTWTRITIKDVNLIQDIAFPDDAHGWLVGDRGAILHTEDGGRSWRRQASGTTQAISGVFFLDRAHGWAAAADGSLLRTTDGGEHWRCEAGTFTAFHGGVLDLFFVNPRVGWAFGGGQLILKTTDGGRTWRLQRDSTGRAYGFMWSAAYFPDEQNGWVVSLAPGSNGHNRVYARTRDGGRTWTDTDLTYLPVQDSLGGMLTASLDSSGHTRALLGPPLPHAPRPLKVTKNWDCRVRGSEGGWLSRLWPL